MLGPLAGVFPACWFGEWAVPDLVVESFLGSICSNQRLATTLFRSALRRSEAGNAMFSSTLALSHPVKTLVLLKSSSMSSKHSSWCFALLD